MFRIVLCITLCLYIFNDVSGKPASLLNSEKGDLVNEFVEFLRHDKELSAALEKEFTSQTLSRQRRQLEADDMNMNLDEVPQEKQQGFFDRAAKFMMELLQRFLKILNPDAIELDDIALTESDFRSYELKLKRHFVTIQQN
ncbi:hypothetical protein Trydic_g16598 [Trypoxylus dichotomus]